MNDELILVDVEDREIGHMDKESVHKYGRLHRAFSVFLIDDGKMLVQTRHPNKYHSGGKKANACCSHPRYGEKLEDAVHRRMQEELGMDCEVKEIFSFTYFSQYASDLFEYEYDHVFVGSWHGSVSFNTQEIQSVEWMELEQLKKELLTNPAQFASWFLIAAPAVIRIWEKNR